MIHLHATRKVLNLGKIDGKTMITLQPEDQELQNWYVTIMGSSFRGKMLVLYIHEPSLITIITRGKTIRKTYPEFEIRLKNLLQRFRFPEHFIENELTFLDEMVIGKTTNKSMLGYINQIVYLLDYWVYDNRDYESINLDDLENKMMSHLSSSKNTSGFITPINFWEKKLDCKLVSFDKW
jgi:hypothetical protein